MIQNYWTHTQKFGYRRYDDERDNAMNVGEWLPVTATFSACLQNNHHHYQTLLRLSHEQSEYDFGFLTVKFMKNLGLVKATTRGEPLPPTFRCTRWTFKVLGFLFARRSYSF
jgi:fatty-acid desaturase